MQLWFHEIQFQFLYFLIMKLRLISHETTMVYENKNNFTHIVNLCSTFSQIRQQCGSSSRKKTQLPFITFPISRLGNPFPNSISRDQMTASLRSVAKVKTAFGLHKIQSNIHNEVETFLQENSYYYTFHKGGCCL